mmetsp:Transcript_21337/g.27991  ORF Transcript_21337/g.27991 Transcript_21337/m.27991 type:complete len:87 (-) Transcript_21337:725-985(-)
MFHPCFFKSEEEVLQKCDSAVEVQQAPFQSTGHLQQNILYKNSPLFWLDDSRKRGKPLAKMSGLVTTSIANDRVRQSYGISGLAKK